MARIMWLRIANVYGVEVFDVVVLTEPPPVSISRSVEPIKEISMVLNSTETPVPHLAPV